MVYHLPLLRSHFGGHGFLVVTSSVRFDVTVDPTSNVSNLSCIVCFQFITLGPPYSNPFPSLILFIILSILSRRSFISIQYSWVFSRRSFISPAIFITPDVHPPLSSAEDTSSVTPSLLVPPPIPLLFNTTLPSPLASWVFFSYLYPVSGSYSGSSTPLGSQHAFRYPVWLRLFLPDLYLLAFGSRSLLPIERRPWDQRFSSRFSPSCLMTVGASLGRYHPQHRWDIFVQRTLP